ncbi:hypothetical protein Smp_000550 [Schistosoma mansoni]|uniref:hypothetical protein n=1 Tax=Schistosoma mansoni TaxID=6183 RepID=UPI0001A61ACC|nr:hypothetical protein Smp_000550 [Schistosoma mansoni]|eukprot:XP_018646312.1 hypothetical protein Smp_000550 [Schistosoma mansoni]
MAIIEYHSTVHLQVMTSCLHWLILFGRLLKKDGNDLFSSKLEHLGVVYLQLQRIRSKGLES